MTRIKVLQLGFAVLALGGIGYIAFRSFGLNGISAGIASESILFAAVIVWTFSYLFRVVTGKMTFMEQRRRYIKAYEECTDTELQQRFDNLSEQEQQLILQETQKEKNSSKPSSDS